MSVHESLRSAVDRVRATRASSVSAFSRNVSTLLKDIEYRRCDSGEDLEDIYRLRYRSYLAAGMISPNESRKIEDGFDDAPNAYRFGVYFEGNLVSTLRLHHVDRQHPQSPSTRVFEEVLMPRIAAGETFVDPSRFAADAEWAMSLRVLPYITLRLAMVACRYFEPSACLTAIKEEHASFYKRVFNAKPVVDGQTYPGLTMPVFLYESTCPEAPDQAEARFPFFKSSRLEQRLLFGATKPGELAPLTILPTAKYSSLAA